MPDDQACRVNCRVDHSPGRPIRGGEYVLYDPYKRCLVDASLARSGVRMNRPHPSSCTTGLIFFESET